MAALVMALLPVGSTTASAATEDRSSYLDDLRAFASAGPAASTKSVRDYVAANHDGCEPDTGLDPSDAAALDIAGYFGGHDCDEAFWAFGVETYDAWELSELDSFAVFMDLDGNPANGCDGLDGGLIAYVDGSLVAAVVRTPTCDQNTWSEGSAVAISPTTSSIAVGTIAEELGSPSSIRWSLGIASIYGDYDLAPGSGTVTSRAGNGSTPGPTPTPTPTPTPGTSGAGYVLLASNGDVYTYGSARNVGSATALCAGVSCSSISVRPSFDGYWIANGACAVGNYGAAPAVGSPNLGASCALERSASGNGYWAVTPQGTVAAHGDAVSYGSAPAGLNAPLVDIARTATGNGYWLLGRDGGIFTAGAAPFFGSTGAMVLNRPVVGMTPTRSGNGYWLVAEDGGIFTFGDAQFYGSTGAMLLNRPIIGMVATPTGRGYWLVAADGGIFTFGDAAFLGSPAGQSPAPTVVAFAGP